MTEMDETVSDLLRERRVGPILRPAMEPLLEALREADEVRLDGEVVKVGEPAPAITVRVERARPDVFRLTSYPAPDVSETFANGAALRGDVLFATQDVDLSENDREALARGRLFETAELHTLVSEVLPGLRKRVPVEIRTRLLPALEAVPPQIQFITVREEGDVVVTPEIVYGDPPVARVTGARIQHLGGILPQRDREAEKLLNARLRSELEMQRGIPRRESGRTAVAMAEDIVAFGGLIEGDGLENIFVGPTLEPELILDDEGAALTFETEYEGETFAASAEAVFNAWRGGEALVPLETGGWAPLPDDFLEEHGHLVADLLAASRDGEHLPRSVGADVARLAEALGQPAPPNFERLRALAHDFEGMPRADLPDGFQGELRAYQRDGVDWLSFLSEAGLGALLADDMGLGKTVQAICVLDSPSLVVCPSSVIHAWQDELERFRPGLSVHRYHAANRRLDEEADVTLTTYAILRRDIAILEEREWSTVVLDEAQHIKNPSSQVAQAACKLPARFRIALTGTPIENRLEDLWSQLHFLNPGLLGGLSDFRERYARPIADGDAEVTARLRQRVRPFVTRRLKREVESELPARTDVILHCNLSEDERAAYDAVRAATREEVVRQLAKGQGVLQALEALLRLRQAACHTGLLPGHEAPTSSKVALLLETLEGALAEGHRALVFSQWTSLLDRVEPHLEAASIAFSRLDGSTRNRGDVVRNFQSDEGPPVMLISLKAGGTGLTLTRADHVFLLDPWWNPAVEDQAADRIHRIGQEHPVLVHRLVAEDTVEESLLRLQERKRTLSSSVLDGGDGGGGPSGLTREDLLELLS
ncbi:MAG: DEAD/DEAH box helicase [Deltaproteobacteria bacterium]|nr:DEAD/DEAH box helicase [Deltaproteobacteria bacterium]